jgi:protein ImuB
MMRRTVSLWFPYWPVERLERAHRRRNAAPAEPAAPRGPLVLAAAGQGGVRLTAVSPGAEAEGLAPGMTLADARALVPGVAGRLAEPEADARELAALADWCIRFTPCVAVDGGDGLLLDVTGCARLHGGEVAMLARMAKAMRGIGFTVRAGLADTPGAAWAAARFLAGAGADGGVVVPRGGARDMLAPLPAAALRLPPEAAAGLERLGLRRVADVIGLPRAPLAARFGTAVGRRIDQALGRESEPLVLRRPVPPCRVRRVFAEPLIDHAGLAAAVGDLVAELCLLLESRAEGVRRLELALFRVDGVRSAIAVGAARPVRDAVHLERLLAVRLETLDPGFGVEAMALSAAVVEPLGPEQAGLTRARAGEASPGALAALVDRLANRLGASAVMRLVPRESHVPERAVACLPAMAPGSGAPGSGAPGSGEPWRCDVPRPLRLFPRPEPVEAVAMVPDSPPVMFLWRGRAHRIARAEGPERLAAEWWRTPRTDGRDFRDYYRVEDETGARFWLYRHGPYGADGAARWYLHGLFA